ncbi:MAG TPA: M28 family peptidase [Planctomycetota bacterium]|nr:M28 family peptidase [Planctomycetota bacterium]
MLTPEIESSFLPRPWETWIAWAAAVLAVVFALAETRPPSARTADAPAEGFSAARAMKHVEIIATKPHPHGSEESERVVAHISKVFGELGLEVEVRESLHGERFSVSAPLRNIVARLRGSASTGTILLAAHHDSVPVGPGAADDGAAVGAMLEVARALSLREPLRNDIVFLVTDGEEKGLLGAIALAEEAPDWIGDVKAVLNFEARGTSGASLLFETSRKAGWLVRRFAKAAPTPLGSSLGYEVYRRMPNDTDFTVFRHLDLEGLNFAMVGGASRYHTPLDSPEHLDPRSVEHHGEHMLSLATDLGALDLRAAPTDEGSLVFFNATRRWLVVYSREWAIGFTAIFVVGLFVSVWASFRARRITLERWAVALVLVPSLVVSAASLVRVLPDRLLPVVKETDLSLLPRDDQTAWYLAGFVLIALAIQGAAIWLARATFGVTALALAGLTWIGALAVLATWWAPGASYVFVWPGIAGLVLFLVTLGAKKSTAGRAARLACAIGAWLVTAVIGAPVVYLATLALSVRAAWIAVIVAMVLLGGVIGALDLLAGRRGWPVLLAGAIGGVACLIAGAMIG